MYVYEPRPDVTSKYRGVSRCSKVAGPKSAMEWSAAHQWQAQIFWGGRRHKKKRFRTEREAAIQYDTWVLELGLDRELNILKRRDIT